MRQLKPREVAWVAERRIEESQGAAAVLAAEAASKVLAEPEVSELLAGEVVSAALVEPQLEELVALAAVPERLSELLKRFRRMDKTALPVPQLFYKKDTKFQPARHLVRVSAAVAAEALELVAASKAAEAVVAEQAAPLALE